MNPIDQIVMTFLKLLGLVKDDGAAKPKPQPKPQAAAPPPAPDSEDDEDTLDEDEDPAEEEWRELQDYIARAEQHAIDLAGIDLGDPASYWAVYFAIEEAEAYGGSRDDAIAQQGFRSNDHWQQMSQYVQAKWSELGRDEDGDLCVRHRDEFTNGMMQARQSGMQAQIQQSADASPELLEPVDGVSVDQWAEAAAGMTKLPPDATPDDVNQYLLGFGMDRARWDTVNTEWTARMSQDSTMVISTKYSEAFTSSMGVATEAQGGGEPCTWEQFVEVMVAQEAWSNSGMDVNAQLQAVFGLDAATYGAWSGYWSPKMSTDIALINQMDSLRDKYLQKYAGADLDADLVL